MDIFEQIDSLGEEEKEFIELLKKHPELKGELLELLK